MHAIEIDFKLQKKLTKFCNERESWEVFEVGDAIDQIVDVDDHGIFYEFIL